MTTEPRRYTLNASLLLLLASLACFALALLVAESIVKDFGTWQEWIAAGLALHVVAELA